MQGERHDQEYSELSQSSHLDMGFEGDAGVGVFWSSQHALPGTAEAVLSPSNGYPQVPHIQPGQGLGLGDFGAFPTPTSNTGVNDVEEFVPSAHGYGTPFEFQTAGLVTTSQTGYTDDFVDWDILATGTVDQLQFTLQNEDQQPAVSMRPNNNLPAIPQSGYIDNNETTQVLDAAVAQDEPSAEFLMNADPIRATQAQTCVQSQVGLEYDNSTPNDNSIDWSFLNSIWTNTGLDPMLVSYPMSTLPSDNILTSPSLVLDTPRATLPPSNPVISAPTVPAFLHRCTITGCAKSFKRDACRRRHEATHCVAQGHHFCPVAGCSARYKRADKLTEHMWRKHANLSYVKAW